MDLLLLGDLPHVHPSTLQDIAGLLMTIHRDPDIELPEMLQQLPEKARVATVERLDKEGKMPQVIFCVCVCCNVG